MTLIIIPSDLNLAAFKGWKVVALPPIPDFNGQVALKCTCLCMFSMTLRADVNRTKVCKPLDSGKEEYLAYCTGYIYKHCEEAIEKAFKVASDPTKAEIDTDSTSCLILLASV